jgi:hypothetical protein
MPVSQAAPRKHRVLVPHCRSKAVDLLLILPACRADRGADRSDVSEVVLFYGFTVVEGEHDESLSAWSDSVANIC